MDSNIFESGSTFITAKNFFEAIMVLSTNVNRKNLLPVLFKYQSYQMYTIKLIESIVLHEKLLVPIFSNHRNELLLQSGTTDLQDIFIEIPDEIYQAIKEAPRITQYLTLIKDMEHDQNFQFNDAKLMSDIYEIHNKDIFSLYNSVFPVSNMARLMADGLYLNGYFPLIVKLTIGDYVF